MKATTINIVRVEISKFGIEIASWHSANPSCQKIIVFIQLYVQSSFFASSTVNTRAFDRRAGHHLLWVGGNDFCVLDWLNILVDLQVHLAYKFAFSSEDIHLHRWNLY